jgi:hypothetical protein
MRIDLSAGSPAKKVLRQAAGFRLYLCYRAGLAGLNGCSAIGGRQTTYAHSTPVIPVKPVYEVQVGEITVGQFRAYRTCEK